MLLSVTTKFNERLTHAMQARGLTTHELARRTGGAFSTRTVFRWRAGDTAPGIEALPILTEQLDVTADWLIGASQLGGPSTNDQGDDQRDDRDRSADTDEPLAGIH